MERRITFNIMSDGRFVCTMRVPLTFDLISGYDGEKPIVNMDRLKKYVEDRRPSLKYRKYNICF